MKIMVSTKVTRLVQDFVINKLSNWHIRLSRRRFWKGEYNKDKISAYQTLYECLEKIAIISAPIAPFYMDQLFKDLNSVSKNIQIIVFIFQIFQNQIYLDRYRFREKNGYRSKNNNYGSLSEKRKEFVRQLYKR